MRLSLILKVLTLQTGQQIITIHILPNLSKSKASQIMKCNIITKYNIRNIFVGTSYSKYGILPVYVFHCSGWFSYKRRFEIIFFLL